MSQCNNYITAMFRLIVSLCPSWLILQYLKITALTFDIDTKCVQWFFVFQHCVCTGNMYNVQWHSFTFGYPISLCSDTVRV